MLSFTLEGDRWRVAGTFDTGTLQQEFDRPSCKRSSLLLYLLSLSLSIFSLSSLSISISLFTLFLIFCLDLFRFALCVTRPFARSQLSYKSLRFYTLLILLIVSLPPLRPRRSIPASPSCSPSFGVPGKGSELIDLRDLFHPRSKSDRSRMQLTLSLLSTSSLSLFSSSVVYFLFICLRILPAFYFILFYNRIILRLVLLDRAAFPALDASAKERYMSVC